MRKQLLVVMALAVALVVACGPTPAPQVITVVSTVEVEKVVTAVPTVAPPAKEFKLAAILPGVITDADYNTLGYLGAVEVEKTYGIKMAYSENVPVPDVERVMREYIADGYNIIFTHGDQFSSQTANVAKEYAEVFFIAEHDTPMEDHPANLWVIDRNFHVPFYAIGATAAKATKTGKIGYLGGQTLSFSYAEVHAVQQALKDLGSNAQFTYVWVGDFNDPTKARELADAMIGDGIDVIMASLNLGVYGVFEAVKKAPSPVLVTAKYTDKSFFAPQNYVTAALYDYKKPLVEIVGKIMNGETKGIYPLGFDTGVAVQLPLQNVPEQVNTEVTQIVADILSGKIEVIEDTSEIK